VRSTHIILSKRNVEIDNNNTSRHHPPTTPRVPGGSRERFLNFHGTTKQPRAPKQNQTNKQTTNKLTSKNKIDKTDRRTQDKPTKYLNTSNKTSTYLKSRLKASRMRCDRSVPTPRAVVRPSVHPSVRLKKVATVIPKDEPRLWKLMMRGKIVSAKLVCIVSASCVYC